LETEKEAMKLQSFFSISLAVHGEAHSKPSPQKKVKGEKN